MSKEMPELFPINDLGNCKLSSSVDIDAMIFSIEDTREQPICSQGLYGPIQLHLINVLWLTGDRGLYFEWGHLLVTGLYIA